MSERAAWAALPPHAAAAKSAAYHRQRQMPATLELQTLQPMDLDVELEPLKQLKAHVSVISTGYAEMEDTDSDD